MNLRTYEQLLLESGGFGEVNVFFGLFVCFLIKERLSDKDSEGGRLGTGCRLGLKLGKKGYRFRNWIAKQVGLKTRGGERGGE